MLYSQQLVHKKWIGEIIVDSKYHDLNILNTSENRARKLNTV